MSKVSDFTPIDPRKDEQNTAPAQSANMMKTDSSNVLMYPAAFPFDISKNPKRTAEQQVYEKLRQEYAADSAEVRIFYSVLCPDTRHDIDFVILDRNRDLVFIEVKGGTDIKGDKLIQNKAGDISEKIRAKHLVMQEVYRSLSSLFPEKDQKFLGYKKVLILPDALSIPGTKKTKAQFGKSVDNKAPCEWHLVLSKKDIQSGLLKKIDRINRVKKQKRRNLAAKLYWNNFLIADNFFRKLVDNNDYGIQNSADTVEASEVAEKTNSPVKFKFTGYLQQITSFSTIILVSLIAIPIPLVAFHNIGLFWVGVLCSISFLVLIIFLFKPKKPCIR